jgi:sulfotransferase family protein
MSPEPSADLAERPVSQRPRVIYVMGAGRSGSTILGVTLGNCANLFYAGELDKWLLRAGRPKRSGERREAFWGEVLGRVADPQPLFGGQCHRYLERSSALLRLRGLWLRRRLRRPYRRVMGELYRAIATVSGATHVVDTSHYPLRARELQRVEGIDLYILLLVRDPRAVIASFGREDVLEPRFGPAKTRAYLLLTHLLCAWVFRKQPPERRMVLRYEDFVADPQAVIGSLLGRVGSPAELPDLGSLSTGIPLQGNRLIHEDVVALRRRQPSAERAVGLERVLNLATIAPLARLGPRLPVPAA